MHSIVQDISDEEINALTQGLQVRYGVDFTCYESKSLKRRFVRLINKFELDSTHALWVKVLKDPAFVQVIMNEISVGMTSMFRDAVMWKKLAQVCKTKFAGQSTIHIWHAGCSTGEEVFSMAILLKQLRLLASAQTLATDFNLNALEEAKAGKYHKIKMIENEVNFKSFAGQGSLSDYYKEEGVNVQMDKSLNSHVRYQFLNLVTDVYPSGFDIVFCRNVMIYFDNATKKAMLQKFHKILKPNGLFIIGFFDTMMHMIDNELYGTLDEEAKILIKK